MGFLKEIYLKWVKTQKFIVQNLLKVYMKEKDALSFSEIFI
jgi:hypothetical protein